MTSRERVIAAINHRNPDRCPIDLGACSQTGMNASTLYRFRKALGLDSHRLKIVEPFQMLGEVEEDLLQTVHSDVVGLWNYHNMLGFANDDWKPFDMDDGTPTYMGGGFTYEKNEKGDTMVFACGDRNAPFALCMPNGGSFFDNVNHADQPFDMDLDEEDLRPLEDFAGDFAVCTDKEARYWEKESKRLYEGTDYAVIGILGGAGLGDFASVPGPSVKHPRGIRKIEDWLTAHILFPDYIREVFRLQTDVMLKNLQIYKEAVGDRIQVIWVSGTDFGTQQGLFTSKEQFRELYKPFYTEINSWIHANTSWKTFYHSCGCVNELLDDFADMGVDCLNPVQFSAMEPKGMSPRRLKDRYGDRLTFWGGGVDTQKTLPFGTPDEVRKEVSERVKILNEGGGYIFSSIHNITAKVPPENLIAMYEAASGGSLHLK